MCTVQYSGLLLQAGQASAVGAGPVRGGGAGDADQAAAACSCCPHTHFIDAERLPAVSGPEPSIPGAAATRHAPDFMPATCACHI